MNAIDNQRIRGCQKKFWNRMDHPYFPAANWLREKNRQIEFIHD